MGLQSEIRRAVRADVPALLEIYNYYVANTHITFDVEPRTLEQRHAWLAQFKPAGRHQCFVAVRDGVAIGWAASAPFKDRAGYDPSIETSVYLAPAEQGHGVGRRLYETLFASLDGEDVHRAYAGVCLPNDASVGVHKAMGFEYVATYREVGRKFGKYWDVAWYAKAMG